MNMRRMGISDDPEFIAGYESGHEVLVKTSDLLKSAVTAKTDPITGGIAFSDKKLTRLSEYPAACTKIWLPCDQGIGNVLDLSGNGADLIPSGTMTQGNMWATADQVTFPGGAGKVATISAAKASVNIIDTSLICFFRFKKPNSAGSEFVFGQGSPASWLFFQCVAGSSNATFYARGGASEETQTLASNITGVANDAWNSVLYAVDAETKTFWIFVNKVLRASGAITLTKTTANLTVPLPFGAQGVVDGSTTAYAFGLQDFLLCTPPAVIDVNLQRIARKLHNTRGACITEADLA